MVTAASAPVGLPHPTPPQTPMAGGHHSATSSVSGSVLGKRDAGATASESEEDGQVKKRRIAPTLVTGSTSGGAPPSNPTVSGV